MNILVDSQYFPPVALIKTSFGQTHIVFDQYEWHRKMGFRNRMLVAGAEGVVSLSIPLVMGRNQQVPAKDVRISNDQPWQAQHWKTILSNYNRSPWFEYYRDELAALMQRRTNFLLDWNLACFEWIKNKLDWDIMVSLTEDYREIYDPEIWTDLRNRFMPKNYRKTEPLKYRQVFEERTGFLPNLSVLDLLCCEGKNAAVLLNQ